MRSIHLGLLVAAVVSLTLLLVPAKQPASHYGSLIGTGTAYADDEVVPIRPKNKACGRVCLEQQGVRYCGGGVGVPGCNIIVLNNCIYTLCP
ncbi:MAG: hypothetical protein ACREOU_02885 [Candidatus Eiseniibacteriota bacterium]